MPATPKPVTQTPTEQVPPTITILIGLMLPPLMMGIHMAMFSVALPLIRADFGIQADVTAWVATINTLPFMMFMPLYGRLGDALGKRRLILAGIILFTLGTGIAAVAPNLTWLMVGRAVQGFGSAGFVPLSIAIITQRFSADQRGKMLGTWNMAFPLTGLIGPYLGGLWIDFLGWRAIFPPVVVLGVLTYVLVYRIIPGAAWSRQPDFLRRFDWSGVFLLSAAITGLLFYASSRPVTGIAPLRDWRLAILGGGLLAGFIAWELRRREPYLPLTLFATQSFTLASVCAGLRMFIMAGIRFLIPLYLVDLYGLNAATIGLIMTGHALPLLLILRGGGQLADRLGSRGLVAGSMLAQMGAMAYLALLPAGAGIGWVALGVMLQSAGAGFSLAPLHRASMAAVDAEQTGVAAGVYSMLRFAGTVFGTALTGVLLQQGLSRDISFIDAYQIAFWFVAGVAALGAVLGARMRA